MIQLIGIKSNCDVGTRQKFSIVSSKLEEKLKSVRKAIGSNVILSTCNRTEIYVDSDLQGKELICEVFHALNWDEQLLCNIFYIKDANVVKHIMEVSCGFHSKILGEDQILGQIKDAYEKSAEARTIKGSLQRLFQNAITCGKEFKNACEVYKIPVSSPSITVKKASSIGFRRYMIIGFGEMGKLVFKYLQAIHPQVVYIVVRNPENIDKEYTAHGNVKLLTFTERKNFYDDIDCIISCTSAPHPIIWKSQLLKSTITIFDLAVPRDVAEDVFELPEVKVYDIDDISSIDRSNKIIRKKKMEEHRYIIGKYIGEFMEWKKLNELSPEIQKIKNYGDEICSRRINTFKNKKYTKDHEMLASVMIHSTAKVYINRAIELLKREKLKGRENECLKFINEIFCSKVD